MEIAYTVLVDLITAVVYKHGGTVTIYEEPVFTIVICSDHTMKPTYHDTPFWKESMEAIFHGFMRRNLSQNFQNSNDIFSPIYRSVSVRRLDYILKNGCDVQPTGALIFAISDVQKALEYGGNSSGFGSRVLQVFASNKLLHSMKRVPNGITSEQMTTVKQTHPYVVWESANTVCLSRFSREQIKDESVRSSEDAYGRYIPADPFEALKSLIVFCDHDSNSEIVALLDAFNSEK